MKSLFASKTFWFNVLTLGYAIASKHVEALSGLQMDTQNTALVSTVANIALRLVTNKGVYVNPGFQE